MELSVADPDQLFNGIEKCYYNYMDYDKLEWGSHWFYHEDLDEGHIVNRGLTPDPRPVYLWTDSEESGDESEDSTHWYSQVF